MRATSGCRVATADGATGRGTAHSECLVSSVGVASSRCVQGEDHAGAAVVTSRAVEPDRLGDVGNRVGEVGVVASETSGGNWAAVDGIGLLHARSGERALGDGVRATHELEDERIADHSSGSLRLVRESTVADLDDDLLAGACRSGRRGIRGGSSRRARGSGIRARGWGRGGRRRSRRRRSRRSSGSTSSSSVGNERVHLLLGPGVDGEDHALLAMVTLLAVEPET